MNFPLCACIDTLYGELPFLDRLQAARVDGFAFVEFWDWTRQDLPALRHAAEEAGIGISGFNGDGPFSLIDPQQREAYLAYLRRSAEAAVVLGARSLTVHSNALGEGGKVLRRYDELSCGVKLCAMVQTLRESVRIVEEANLQLHLEALNISTDHPGNFLSSTRMAAEIVEAVGSPRLDLLYDVYHMQLTEGALCDHIRRYGSLMGHVHIADAPGRHEPGTGEIFYPAVLSALEAAGYSGLIGCELFPKTTTAAAVAAICGL